MPIDIDKLRALVKLAGTIGSDAGSQAMAAAAQAAKPAGGIPLPKPVEDKDDPAGSALDEQKAQIEQDKLEQQRRKELDAKENEIRGLKHELELEQVERERATKDHELDLRVRQEQDKLKSERDKLDRDKFQLVQEKARQDNMFKAEEMKHQADMDKITFKQEAEIAKQEAKATSDLAKQQAQQYVKTTDQARKASDKYYTDAQNKLKQVSPAISPALQSQLDNAISSLNKFRAIHKKQVAIPKPGTPPDFTKLAMVKWATYGDTLNQQAEKELQRRQDEADGKELIANNVRDRSSAYAADRGYANLKNRAAMAAEDGDKYEQDRYNRLAEKAKAQAGTNYNYNLGQSANNIEAKKDVALHRSYTDKRTRFQIGTNGQSIPGFKWLDDWMFGGGGLKYINESQMDRDANAYNTYRRAKDYDQNANWAQKSLNAINKGLFDPVFNTVNSVNDMRANMRNADYFGANRFWNTTFDDPRMKGAYNQSLVAHNYGDSIMGDIGRVGLNAGSTLLDIAATKNHWLWLGAIPLHAWADVSGLDHKTLNPSGEFNYVKQASIPVPGAPPMVKKSDAGLYTAPASNTGYDWASTNNPWYNDPTMTGMGSLVKFMSPIISAATGNVVNLLATPGKFEGYLRPKSIVPGQRLAQNMIEGVDSWKGGFSNMHKVVDRAAQEKAMGGTPQGNFNGTADFRSGSANLMNNSTANNTYGR